MKANRMIFALGALALAACGSSNNNGTEQSDSLSVETKTVDTLAIEQRVEELVKHIPDHQFNAQDSSYFTPEYYSLLKKAWAIPTPEGEIGDEEFLSYFIEGNGDCEGNHRIVVKDLRVEKDHATEDLQYYHGKNFDEHTIKMQLIDTVWVISDWDSTKAQLKEYIDNNFWTPDLAFADVKGRVRSVVYSDKRKAYFDENERLTAYKTAFASTHNIEGKDYKSVRDNGNVETKLERDTAGYIVSVTDKPGSEIYYQYSEDGYCLQGYAFSQDNIYKEYQFSYNENGNLQVSIIETVDEGIESPEGTFEIKVEATDSHGNWTKRTFNNQKEERKIEYYEED